MYTSKCPKSRFSLLSIFWKIRQNVLLYVWKYREEKTRSRKSGWGIHKDCWLCFLLSSWFGFDFSKCTYIQTVCLSHSSYILFYFTYRLCACTAPALWTWPTWPRVLFGSYLFVLGSLDLLAACCVRTHVTEQHTHKTSWTHTHKESLSALTQFLFWTLYISLQQLLHPPFTS